MLVIDFIKKYRLLLISGTVLSLVSSLIAGTPGVLCSCISIIVTTVVVEEMRMQ